MVKSEFRRVYDANMVLQRDMTVCTAENEELRGLVREKEECLRELEGEREREKEEGMSALAAVARQMQVCMCFVYMYVMCMYVRTHTYTHAQELRHE
jgi:hypothetical protein